MPEVMPDKFDMHKQRCSGCNFYTPIDSKQGHCRLTNHHGNDKTVRINFHCDGYVGVYIGSG